MCGASREEGKAGFSEQLAPETPTPLAPLGTDLGVEEAPRAGGSRWPGNSAPLPGMAVPWRVSGDRTNAGQNRNHPHP